MLPSFLIFAMMLMLLVSGIVSSNTFCVITTIFAVITMIWVANRFVNQLVLILGGTLGHTLRQRNEFLPFAESAR